MNKTLISVYGKKSCASVVGHLREHSRIFRKRGDIEKADKSLRQADEIVEALMLLEECVMERDQPLVTELQLQFADLRFRALIALLKQLSALYLKTENMRWFWRIDQLADAVEMTLDNFEVPVFGKEGTSHGGTKVANRSRVQEDLSTTY